MRITDFESGKSLNDVCLTLTREEAAELSQYLIRLASDRPDLRHVHLTEIQGATVERELAVALAA
jgi:hypothetical protein